MSQNETGCSKASVLFFLFLFFVVFFLLILAYNKSIEGTFIISPY